MWYLTFLWWEANKIQKLINSIENEQSLEEEEDENDDDKTQTKTPKCNDQLINYKVSCFSYNSVNIKFCLNKLCLELLYYYYYV